MIERYADLAATVLSTRPRLGPVLLVGVDGASGTGKTTFAERLTGALVAALASPADQRQAGPAVVVVHTDDLLDGWSDLADSWSRVWGWILEPLSRGRPARYRAYDWHKGRFDDEWQEIIPPPRVLVLEGVGSTRAEAGPYLSLSIFIVVADRDLRLHRSLARDGEHLREPLLRWMCAEDRHFAADGPMSRTDVLVDGAPSLSYDPHHEYVRIAAAPETRPYRSNG